jgi:hypothetical protein
MPAESSIVTRSRAVITWGAFPPLASKAAIAGLKRCWW